MRRWIDAFLVVAALVIIFVTLTGDQLVKLRDRNSRLDDQGYSVDDIENSLKEDEELTASDEVILADANIEDEQLALSDTSNQDPQYIDFLGRDYKTIDNELVIVYHDQRQLYGSLVRYGSNRFYLGEDGLCYGVKVVNDTLLDIKVPLKLDRFEALVGQPIFADRDGLFYKYQGYILYVTLKGDYVISLFAGQDMAGSLTYGCNLEGHIDHELISYLNYSEEELNRLFGNPVMTETKGKTNYYYQMVAYSFVFDNQQVESIKTERDGALGLRIGDEFNEADYITYSNKTEDKGHITYQYKLIDLDYEVSTRNGIIDYIQINGRK